MAELEVKVARDVVKSLSKEKGAIFLLGWAEGRALTCSGCARDVQEWDKIVDFKDAAQQAVAVFPAGIRIVGLYYPCSETLAKEQSEELFNQLLRCDVEEYVVGPLMAFICQSAQKDDSGCESPRSFVYDARTEKSAPASLSLLDRVLISSNNLLMRIKGKMPLSFEMPKNTTSVETNIEKAISLIKDQIASSACVYHLQKTSVIIRNSEKKICSHPLLNGSSKCTDLVSCVQGNDEDDGNESGFLNKKQKHKNSNSPKMPILNLRLLLQTTGEDAIKNTISCVPIIRYERRDFINVGMVLGIDVLVVVPLTTRLVDLPSLFTNGVCAQVVAMQQVLCRFYQERNGIYLPTVYHFEPQLCGQTFSVIYPEEASDLELGSYRQDLHTRLLLPLDRPALRKSMRYSFPDEQLQNGYLRNVHVGLPPSGMEGGEVAVVQGTYTYHHYMQDHFDDDGWGCAYRSLQTLLSWFAFQGYTEKPISTHFEIQKALVDIGDKPPSFLKSKKWIGSMEVSYCLDHLIGISSKIISVSSGSELSNKGRELVNHFVVQGTPIMIGGGVLAHTILGVHVNFQTGEIKFLILDPHYTGAEDIAVIQAKGWCGWKGIEFWDKTAYYNLCCPQRPPGI